LTKSEVATSYYSSVGAVDSRVEAKAQSLAVVDRIASIEADLVGVMWSKAMRNQCGAEVEGRNDSHNQLQVVDTSLKDNLLVFVRLEVEEEESKKLKRVERGTVMMDSKLFPLLALKRDSFSSESYDSVPMQSQLRIYRRDGNAFVSKLEIARGREGKWKAHSPVSAE